MTTAISAPWRVMPLLDIVAIRSGQVDPRQPPYRDMPLVAPDHIESGTGRLLQVQTAGAQGAISGKYLVDAGDVIYSKIRPYLRKAHLATFQALCSADMYPLKPRPGTDGRFVLNTLLSRDFTNFAVGASMRSGIPKINRTELAEFMLLVPPTTAQCAIGRALGDADELVRSLERLIAKKRAIKQGMMQELLTGQTRLPGCSSSWREVPLRTVLTVRHGRSQRGVETPNGRFPILATGGEIGRTDVPLYSKPSVLIGRKGTIDRPQFQEAPFWTVDTLFYTEISTDADPRFLYYLFQTIDWRSMNEASGVPSLKASTIEAVEVSIPDRAEQDAIARVLSDDDAEVDALERRLEAARNVKQGMMQELLTGRTRLSVEGDAA